MENSFTGRQSATWRTGRISRQIMSPIPIPNIPNIFFFKFHGKAGVNESGAYTYWAFSCGVFFFPFSLLRLLTGLVGFPIRDWDLASVAGGRRSDIQFCAFSSLKICCFTRFRCSFRFFDPTERKSRLASLGSRRTATAGRDLICVGIGERDA